MTMQVITIYFVLSLQYVCIEKSLLMRPLVLESNEKI